MWSQVREFGYEESFKGNEDNSIIKPQLKPNGVKLGLMAQSQKIFFLFESAIDFLNKSNRRIFFHAQSLVRLLLMKRAYRELLRTYCYSVVAQC